MRGVGPMGSGGKWQGEAISREECANGMLWGKADCWEQSWGLLRNGLVHTFYCLFRKIVLRLSLGRIRKLATSLESPR